MEAWFNGFKDYHPKIIKSPWNASLHEDVFTL